MYLGSTYNLTTIWKVRLIMIVYGQYGISGDSNLLRLFQIAVIDVSQTFDDAFDRFITFGVFLVVTCLGKSAGKSKMVSFKMKPQLAYLVRIEIIPWNAPKGIKDVQTT